MIRGLSPPRRETVIKPRYRYVARCDNEDKIQLGRLPGKRTHRTRSGGGGSRTWAGSKDKTPDKYANCSGKTTLGAGKIITSPLFNPCSHFGKLPPRKSWTARLFFALLSLCGRRGDCCWISWRELF